MLCPKCKSDENVIKFGFMEDSQRYRCKTCKYNFTKPQMRGMSFETKLKAIGRYLDGKNYRQIENERIANYVSVGRLIKAVIKKLNEIVKSGQAPQTIDMAKLKEIHQLISNKGTAALKGLQNDYRNTFMAVAELVYM